MYRELIDTQEIDGFDIEIYACEEHTHPDDVHDWENEEDRRKTLELIESNGLMGWFCAVVEAKKNDIVLGRDSLGACSYNSVREFLNDDYCKDMIENAITEAKANIELLISEDK